MPLIITEHGLAAGQDPGQRIAQYFLPELGLPLSLSGCENGPVCVSLTPPEPGPTLALTLTHIRPVLRALTHATRTRTLGLPCRLPQLLQTDGRLTEVA